MPWFSTIQYSFFEICPWFHVHTCNFFISIALYKHTYCISQRAYQVFLLIDISVVSNFFVTTSQWTFLYTSPGSRVHGSRELDLGVRLLVEKAYTSETSLDNDCSLQQLPNLYCHQPGLGISVAHIFACHGCHSQELAFAVSSDVLTCITLVSNHRCDSISIQSTLRSVPLIWS